MTVNNWPIGVFDSGVGGLTVLKALRRRLPKEDFVYLGDTARLPYGTKSPQTVNRYALQASSKLVEQKIKALVVACNTASSFALDILAKAYDSIPVYGVVEPGADAACRIADDTGILILATESTVLGGAYQKSILGKIPELPVYARACPLWVTLAEQGLYDENLASLLIEHYFEGFGGDGPKTVLLGCTHFPILLPLIDKVMAGRFAVVDSAKTTAESVANQLETENLLNIEGGHVSFMATDGIERFGRIGKRFLGEEVGNVLKVDL